MSNEPLTDLARQREEYETTGLDVDDVLADPIEQFVAWFGEADAGGVYEPNAMVVSTVDAEGWPDSRVVLVKGIDHSGFVFYTNYSSAKGAALAVTPRAAANFAWLPLHRQVRIVGDVEQVSPDESDTYFALRPIGSQIGAWASDQSTHIESRAALEQQWQTAADRFAANQTVARPPHWGGYRIAPRSIEFWQGRKNRMHDRLRYIRDGETWTVSRLQP